MKRQDGKTLEEDLARRTETQCQWNDPNLLAGSRAVTAAAAKITDVVCSGNSQVRKGWIALILGQNDCLEI